MVFLKNLFDNLGASCEQNSISSTYFYSKDIAKFIKIFMMKRKWIFQNRFPIFKNSIKKENLISDYEINGTTILKFATNDSVEDIKKILIKTMGKEWVEIPDKIDLGRKGKLAIPGGKLKRPKSMGTARFINPKHPGIHIHLAIIEIPAKGKIYTALVTTMKLR